jgi:hypothetical protein
MESNFSNRDFEQHIKENADQYRMFPSDKVWKGVHNALHTRRKWYGLGLGLLLLLTGGAVTWVMTIYPASKRPNETTELNTSIGEKKAVEQSIVTSPAQTIKDLLPFNKPAESIDDNQSPVEDITPVITLAVPEIAESPAQIAALQQHQIYVRQETDPAAINTIIANTIVISQNGPVAAEPEDAVSTGLLPSIATKRNTPSSDVNLLTIESVTNSYQRQKASRKISWQLFVTPTISYRKLSVNKSYDYLSDNNFPTTANYPFASITDVNKAVTHKPDLGVQLGVAARYPLSRNLRLRGGLQFNINRYDIKAFAYNKEIATINLNTGTGSNSAVSAWTRYRNYSGYKSDWLKNFYFSVSAPIGAELDLIGNKKTSWGIAGTVQPTYVVSDRAYMISTDYKNYAKVPWLIRNMNVSSSFETFINYTSGKTKWQIGPQVRYQMLSSFKNKYPVKENLFDFGLKLGITLNE